MAMIVSNSAASVFDRLLRIDRGGVVHHAHRACRRPRSRPRPSAGRRGRIGDVVDVQRRAARKLGHQRLAPLLVAAVDQHAGAFGHRAPGNRLADAGGAAGDQNDFVFQTHGEVAVGGRSS